MIPGVPPVRTSRGFSQTLLFMILVFFVLEYSGKKQKKKPHNIWLTFQIALGDRPYSLLTLL